MNSRPKSKTAVYLCSIHPFEGVKHEQKAHLAGGERLPDPPGEAGGLFYHDISTFLRVIFLLFIAGNQNLARNRLPAFHYPAGLEWIPWKIGHPVMRPCGRSTGTLAGLNHPRFERA